MPMISEALWQELPLILSGVIPAGQIGVTEPVSVGALLEKTIYVKSTGNVKVHVLFGPDQEDCSYSLKSGTAPDTEDTDREWVCNNESIAFQIIEHCSWIKIVLESQESSADSTVSVWIS